MLGTPASYLIRNVRQTNGSRYIDVGVLGRETKARFPQLSHEWDCRQIATRIPKSWATCVFYSVAPLTLTLVFSFHTLSRMTPNMNLPIDWPLNLGSWRYNRKSDPLTVAIHLCRLIVLVTVWSQPFLPLMFWKMQWQNIWATSNMRSSRPESPVYKSSHYLSQSSTMSIRLHGQWSIVL